MIDCLSKHSPIDLFLLNKELTEHEFHITFKWQYQNINPLQITLIVISGSQFQKKKSKTIQNLRISFEIRQFLLKRKR